MERDYGHIWATRTAPTLAYAVLPKCGCSSLGQLLYYLDHGAFFEGSIHDKRVDLLKSAREEDATGIDRVLKSPDVIRFTFARNPYQRLLSAFADKVFGYGPSGRRYRQGALQRELMPYGLGWGPDAYIADNFHSFVRFVADTIEKNEPTVPDKHWNPMTQRLRAWGQRNHSWKIDYFGRLENFKQDVSAVLAMSGKQFDFKSVSIPHENATSLPRLPITEYYGDAERRIMARVYGPDFELFGYSLDPEAVSPTSVICPQRVNDALRI